MIINVILVVISLINLFHFQHQKKILNVLIVKSKILKNYFVLLIFPMEGMAVNRKMFVILHQVFPEQTNSVVTENYIAD